MNQLTIIGNLTRDPETRATMAGDTVCTFTVAVSRRKSRNADDSKPEADFFRVSAWRQLGDTCQKYLSKGRKVCVVGSVSCRTYQGTDGVTRSSLEVNATDVEFLSSRQDDEHAAAVTYAPAAPQSAPSAPVSSAPVPSAPAPQQTALPHPGNIDTREREYLTAERAAIQNEKKYVVVDPNDELPF